MSLQGVSGGATAVSPDEAFDVLCNDTRVRILRALGEADDRLSFTELRNRVGLQQGGRFNYHLDKLVGHFVEKTDDGYALREPGRRIIQAIRSGAVTDDPVLDPTEIDFTCRHCDEPVEVWYSQGTLRLSCRECGGGFDDAAHRPERETSDDVAYGNLANLSLPPAGVQRETADDVFRAAATLAHIEALSASCDVCPRCAAPVDCSIASICSDHDASDGLCDECAHRTAVRIRFECTNCIYERTTSAVMGLLDVPELLVFLGDHGLNATSHGIEWGWMYDEDVRSTDPFEAEFTFSIDGDSISLTVDDDLNVLDVTTA